MSKGKKRVERINYELMTPFGPSIMVGTIPDGIYNQFKDIIKRVLKEKKRDHSSQLAGRIEEEWTIDVAEYLWQTQVEEFLLSISQQFGIQVLKRSYLNSSKYEDPSFGEKNFSQSEVKSRIGGGWVNEMKSGEYNPIHYHPFCNVTSVFYFNDIDDKFIKEIIAPGNTYLAGVEDAIGKGTSGDGFLELLYHSIGYFEQGSIRIRPKEKMFLVFPATLLHTVYPFNSDDVRISASFNFTLHSNSGLINFGER